MKKRLIGLDLFRVFLAIVVFMFHSMVFAGCDYSFLNFLAGAGSSFMTAFFMLSGFSIFYSMKDKELFAVKDIRDFYIKRLIGIIPLFWVVMIVYHVVWGELSFRKLLFLLPMDLLGLRSTMSSFPNNQFIWFVSNIIFCYLFYPFLHSVINQMRTKAKVILIGVLVVLVVYATQVIPGVFALSAFPYYSIFYRVAEFLIGMLLASFMTTSKKIIHKPWIAWMLSIIELVILLLGMKLINNALLYAVFLFLCFGVLLFSLSECECRWLEKSKFIGYITSCTYALYLAQVWTLRLFEKTVPNFLSLAHNGSNLLRLVIVWVSTIVLTVFLHELIEKPSKKILSKILLKN